jgi:hypothetical protein
MNQAALLFEMENDFDAEIDAAVAHLNRLWKTYGTEMADIDPDRRHMAFELEREMTLAANRGDLPQARAALKQWTQLFTPERSLL